MNKKSKLLGMPQGTAQNRLRKMILFQQLVKHGENVCFRCGERIDAPMQLSIEHKDSWQMAENPVESFFDLDNIAFSHLSCNCGHNEIRIGKEFPIRHGTNHGYHQHDCRCELCRYWKSIENKRRIRFRPPAPRVDDVVVA